MDTSSCLRILRIGYLMEQMYLEGFAALMEDPSVRTWSQKICSYLVAKSFEAAGKDFGEPGYAATPDGMWDFCVEHGDKYQFVTQRGDMYNL